MIGDIIELERVKRRVYVNQPTEGPEPLTHLRWAG